MKICRTGSKSGSFIMISVFIAMQAAPVQTQGPIGAQAQTANWDIFSTIISIISLVVTTVIATITIVKSQNERKVILEAEHFRQVVSDYMLKKLPETRNGIEFVSDNRLHNCEDFEQALRSFKKSILYYKYMDDAFYSKVSKAICAVEDCVVMAQNKSHIDKSMFDNDLTMKLKDLYKICTSYYYGIRRLKIRGKDGG
jgi:hypothetical protein